jgi:hypothetical protein
MRDFRLLCMWILGFAALSGALAAALPPCAWSVMAVSGICALVAIAWRPE